MVLTVRYRAQSGEQKEGLCELAFHLETGAHDPDLTSSLETALRCFDQGASGLKGLSDHLRKVLGGIKKAVSGVVLREKAAFQDNIYRFLQPGHQDFGAVGVRGLPRQRHANGFLRSDAPDVPDCAGHCPVCRKG
jgi:hypothetical protein